MNYPPPKKKNLIKLSNLVLKMQRYTSVIKTHLLKYLGLEIGQNSYVYWKASIDERKGHIKIGKNTMIGRTKIGYHASMPFYTTLFTDEKDALIEIGDNCRINGAYIHAQKRIQIGNNCVIASNVNIIDSNGHETNSDNRTKGSDQAEDIIIGNNVWVGINAVILKGTTIGNNCIVAAGSVVKGNYPDNCIIGYGIAKVQKILSNIHTKE